MKRKNKMISLIFKGIIFSIIINVLSCAIDESDSDLSDCSKEIIKHNFSKKYTIVDWMPPITKNIFNQKSYFEQQLIKDEIIKHSFQITELMGIRKKNKEKISNYLCKIANDKNPIHESPIVAMEDIFNKYHNITIIISNILTKIITNQIIFVNQSVIYSNIFSCISKI